jgi:hypothetical protein
MRFIAAGLIWMWASVAAAQPAPAMGPKVDQPGKLPETAPATVPDLAYDSRLISSYASIKSFMGPLDGGWTLAAKKGGDLYDLQFSDRQGVAQGAWRDLRQGRDPNGSGLVDQVQRTPKGLLLRFTPPGQDVVTVNLRRDLTGELVQGRRHKHVVLRKVAR